MEADEDKPIILFWNDIPEIWQEWAQTNWTKDIDQQDIYFKVPAGETWTLDDCADAFHKNYR